VAITSLPFLVLALLYFIVEIRTVLQDNESCPHCVFLCVGKKLLISLRSSILLTALTQINPASEIDDEILNNGKNRDGFGSIRLSGKSGNESHGKIEEAQHSDVNLVISNIPSTGPQENIIEENRQQNIDTSAKKVIKKNPDSMEEEQTILVTQQDAIKEKILNSQENSTSKQLKRDRDVTSERTIQLLEKKIEKQKKELTIVSEWVRLLRKENNALKMKILQLEGAKKVSDVLTNAKERNLEELLEGKSMQVQRLQCTVQMLDIENVDLKTENIILATSEKQLNKEINALQMTIAKIDQKPDIYQSQSTADWKTKLDIDLLTWKTRIQTTIRKTDSFSTRGQHKRWTIKRMEPRKHRHANRIQHAPTDYMYKPVQPKSEKWLAREENESYKLF